MYVNMSSYMYTLRYSYTNKEASKLTNKQTKSTSA